MAEVQTSGCWIEPYIETNGRLIENIGNSLFVR